MSKHYHYTPTSLSEAIHKTNSSKILIQTAKLKNIFESREKIDKSIQLGDLDVLRPILLPDVSILRTHFIETEEEYEPIFAPHNFSF